MTDYQTKVDANNFGVFLHLDEASGTPVNYGTDAGATINLVGAGVTYGNACPATLSPNGAIGFTGSHDYLEISGISDAGYFDSLGVLHFWVYVTGYLNDAIPATICAIEFSSGANSWNTVYLTADGSTDTIRLHMGTEVSSDIPFSRNEWHQISINKTGSSFVDGIWLDGRFMGRPSASSGLAGARDLITFGHHWLTPSGQWYGRLSHVHGTQTAWASDDAASDSNRQLWAYGSQALNALEQSVVDRYPRLYFRFDETSGSTAASVLEKDLAWPLNGTPVFNEPGFFAGDLSVRFDDDGDNAYKFLAGGPAFTTVAAWVRINSPGAGDAVVLSRGSDNGNGLRVVYSSGPDRLRLQGSAGFSSGSFAINLGQWYFVVVTTNGGNEQLFVDGTLVIDEALANTTGGYYVGWGDLPSVGNWCDANYTHGFASHDPMSAADISAIYTAAQSLIDPTFALSVPMQWTGEAFVSGIPIEWDVTNYIDFSVPLDWTGEHYSIAAQVQWDVSALATLAIPLRWDVTDTASWPRAASNISAVVLIDGADMSSRVTGRLTIDREEDASAIATYSFVPNPGPIDPMSWLSRPTSIDIEEYVDGVKVAGARRFTGIVSNAEYDPDQGVVTITATTDLQGILENMDRDAIAATVGGSWSAMVFDDAADGWQYALDRMSTQPKCMFQDENRQIRVVDWAAKSTPDFTFTDAGRFDGTLKIRLATRRELLNRVLITMEYRFKRKRQREVKFACIYGGTICDLLLNPVRYLQKSMVKDAVDGAGWHLQSDIRYEPMYPGGYYYCSFSASSGMTPIGVLPAPDTLCMGARFTLAKRWAQTVTEHYLIDVKAPDSIEYSGEIGIEERYAAEAKAEIGDFEKEPFDGRLAGMVENEIGDWYIDETSSPDDGRAAFEEAQQVAMASAKTAILASHRQNSVSFEVPYHHAVDLSHTVEVSGSYLTARGKVRRVVHTIDVERGEAKTAIEIALSRHGGSGVATDTAIAPVAATETTSEPEYSKSVYLPWHIGGDPSSPELTGDEIGFFTNRMAYPSWDPSINAYPYQFVVETHEIDPASRQATEAQGTETIEVSIPQDTLTMVA